MRNNESVIEMPKLRNDGLYVNKINQNLLMFELSLHGCILV